MGTPWGVQGHRARVVENSRSQEDPGRARETQEHGWVRTPEVRMTLGESAQGHRAWGGDPEVWETPGELRGSEARGARSVAYAGLHPTPSSSGGPGQEAASGRTSSSQGPRPRPHVQAPGGGGESRGAGQCGHRPDSAQRRTRRCGPRGSVEMPGPVGRTHLDDELVLQHGIPHHPQPLVLHPGPEVGHGQGPPDRREDLAWGAARRRWLRLQGTFQVLFSRAHKVSHRGRVLGRRSPPGHRLTWAAQRCPPSPSAEPEMGAGRGVPKGDGVLTPLATLRRSGGSLNNPEGPADRPLCGALRIRQDTTGCPRPVWARWPAASPWRRDANGAASPGTSSTDLGQRALASPTTFSKGCGETPPHRGLDPRDRAVGPRPRTPRTDATYRLRAPSPRLPFCAPRRLPERDVLHPVEPVWQPGVIVDL